MAAEAILLDTCAAIWLAEGDPLTPASRTAIDTAVAANVGVWVSAISAWEVATLAAKRRLVFAVDVEIWVDRLLGLPGVRLAALTPRILVRSAVLPGDPPADPADRMIAATARDLGLTVITRDRRLLEYADRGYLRAIGC
jgi:PIN domain nuclease of toxin-antitoxin system